MCSPARTRAMSRTCGVAGENLEDAAKRDGVYSPLLTPAQVANSQSGWKPCLRKLRRFNLARNRVPASCERSSWLETEVVILLSSRVCSGYWLDPEAETAIQSSRKFAD